jgi:rhamnose transport system permease protein
MKWEWLLLLIFIAFNIVIIIVTPYYLDVKNIFNMTFIFVEKGFVALIMAFIIITGNIDISVASIMGLSSVVMAVSYQAGVNIWVSLLIGLSVGTLCGFINGIIITKLGFPSIIITLANYSFYRGIAYVILGDKAVSGFTKKFAYLGQGYIGNSIVPFSLVVFLCLTVIAGVILHKTKFGRMVYAIGWNRNTCFASGIPVKKIELFLFTISGFMAGLAGMFITSRIGNTRPNIATGFELEIITIVILGGIMITGGVGNMWGVFLSIILIGTIRYGLGLHNVPGQVMLLVSGGLLIISILINNIIKRSLAFKSLST